jgi:hypothetical protein
MISMQKARVVLATAFQWSAAIIGFVIIGSCTAAGLGASGAAEGWLSLAGGIVVAIFVSGWIFLAAGLCKDIIAIRQKLSAGEKAAGPEPQDDHKRAAGAG